MQVKPIAVLLLILVSAAQAAPREEAPKRVQLRNGLIPGAFTEHTVARVIRRTAHRPKLVESLTYEEISRWLQCNVDRPKAGRIIFYHMVVDQPARILRLFRGEKAVAKLPPADQFNLPRGGTRLSSEKKSARDAPLTVPGTEPVEKAVLAAMLDFAHWPAKPLKIGEKWSRQIRTDAFEGRQAFELVRVIKLKDAAAAEIKLSVNGKFTGRLEKDYAFNKGEAVFQWSRLDQSLIGLNGKASYERKYGDGKDEFDMEIRVVLDKRETLTEAQQETVKQQLTRFADALAAERENNIKEARELCSLYLKEWPKSLWKSAIVDLQDRLSAAERKSSERLPAGKLMELIGKSIVAFEAARSSGNQDMLDRTRTALASVAEEYHATLLKLAKNSEPRTRANAVFALAFGRGAGDLTIVRRAIEDDSAKVRTLALTGLAARGDVISDAQTLLKAMDDKEVSVRRRACQAIAACIPREHLAISAVVEKVNHTMIHDENDGVRLDAIRTLEAIGAPADIAKIEKALTHEMNQNNRAALERARETLRKR